MDQAFFIAQRQEDGTPGRPVGNDDGAIMMFEELELAKKVQQEMDDEHGPLAIFQLNVKFVGEVVA